jgi:arabinofuranosyltransferase
MIRAAFAPPRLRDRPIFQWLLLSIVLGFIVWLTPFAIIDDAYISFRHAYNLSHAGELVFNRGERVEGMTNLLWTLLLAGNSLLHLLSPQRFAVVVSLVCLLWAAFRLVQLGYLLRAPFYAGLLACGLLFLSPDFLLATTNGLEGGLYAALLLELVCQYHLRHVKRAYAVAGLLFLTRPESLALGALLTGVLYFEERSWRGLRAGMALLGTVVIGVTLWRLFYYGSPLPNSLIAKSMGLHSWLGHLGWVRLKLSLAYIAKFSFTNWHFMAVLGLSAVWFWATRRQRGHARGLLTLCLGSLVYSVLVMFGNGGDWMPHGRLFMYYGTLYAALFLMMARHRRALRIGAILVGYALLQTTVAALHAPPQTLSVRIDPGPDTFDGRISDRLRFHLEASDVLSAEAIGYISCQFPENYIHDPVGLTDKYLARHGRPSIRFGKCDPTYTLGVVRPSVVVWHFGAHVQGVEQGILDQYEVFCAADCGTEGADIVMIRRDRAYAFAPLFSDWQPVRLTTEGAEEPLAEREPAPPDAERNISLRASIPW